ncbi:MAG: hypothetical protein GXZ08_07150 [Tissierellia bacterium]|nr:hypothetical protein [Tissierellia bacterium]
MTNILSLLKIDYLQLKNSISYKNSTDKNRYLKGLGIAFILLISLGPVYIMGALGIWSSYELMSIINHETLFLLVGVIMAQIVIFIFSIPTVLNKYYFMTDIEVLIPLPLKPFEILGSKFFSLYFRELLFSCGILLPFVLVHGVKNSLGLLYYIKGLFVIGIVPVVPLTISSILMMIFMRVTNLSKKKDLVRGFGLLLVLIISLMLTFGMQKFTNMAIENNISEAEVMNYIIVQMDGMSDNIGALFPLGMMAANFLFGSSSLINGLLLTGFSILGFAIILLLSQKIYLNGFIEGKTKTKAKLSSKEVTLHTNIKKPYIAIFEKELKTLFRSPIYLFNSLGSVVIMPIILLFTVTIDDGLVSMLNVYNIDRSFIILGLCLISLFLNVGNIGSTSFSREGKNFWIQKLLPIHGIDQGIGRALAAIFISGIGCLIMIIVANFITSLSILDNIVIFILSLALTIPPTGLFLYIDISRPKLNWKSPEEAMKQNLNALISMGVLLLYMLILFAINIPLLFILPFFSVIGINLFIAGALTVLIFKKLANKIEYSMKHL